MPLKANIKKFVMLSSMGADKPEENSIARVLKAKYNADEYLKVSGLNYIVLSDQVH
jgi:uncharacterized protein YbjT (DUF2867 family)